MTGQREKASLPTTMAIGAFAGAASKTAVAPLERVRLLLQMAPARGEGSRSASSGFSAVMRSEGVLGLWRGNGLSIVRAMLSKGILFSSQDVLAGTLSLDINLSPEPEPEPELEPGPDPEPEPETEPKPRSKRQLHNSYPDPDPN